MITVQRGSWTRLYCDTIRRAADEGYARPSRDGESIDLGPALLACPAPVFGIIPGRGGSTEFARLEQLGYLAGVGSDHLLGVAPSYARFKDPVLGWHGAYGPRLLEQFPRVVSELSKRTFTRRAVALIWNTEDNFHVAEGNLKDVPCTMALSYWLGPAGELRSEAFMRSTDLWLGLYYDMPAFAFLQKAVAKALHRSAGLTYLTTSSLHLYERNAKDATHVRSRYENEFDLVHQIIPEPPVYPPTARWDWLVDWARTELRLDAAKEADVIRIQ